MELSLCFGTTASLQLLTFRRKDSGGPVIVEGADGDLLAGVVSSGDRDCSGLPGVFTRVSAYEQWIKDEACDGNNLTNCT